MPVVPKQGYNTPPTSLWVVGRSIGTMYEDRSTGGEGGILNHMKCVFVYVLCMNQQVCGLGGKKSVSLKNVWKTTALHQ